MRDVKNTLFDLGSRLYLNILITNFDVLIMGKENNDKGVKIPFFSSETKVRECLTDELWKKVIGYDEEYMVSNYGRIKSLNKRSIGLILSQKKRAYLSVGLHKERVQKFHLVHRLVAEAFLSNQYNKLQVNHIDGNKHNNHVSNLEWCTAGENQIHSVNVLGNKPLAGASYQYGVDNLRARSVLQMKNGVVIAEYGCINEATQKTGIIHSGISRCCMGKQRTSKGYEWRYKEKRE